jgi:hypothetical protein
LRSIKIKLYFMSTKQNKLIKLFSLILTLNILTACEKDHHDGYSPAKIIAASEKLSIPASVAIPANAPAGNSRVATYYAKGVQIYKAAQAEGGVFVWIFVAPRADLYDHTNKKVGVHGAGPFWTISPADSIFGQAFTPARTAPATEAGSIDWLLLKPKDGTTPTGTFADVDYIQRIATKGGKAPAQAPINLSSTAEMPYEAIYRFTRKNL